MEKSWCHSMGIYRCSTRRCCWSVKTDPSQPWAFTADGTCRGLGQERHSVNNENTKLFYEHCLYRNKRTEITLQVFYHPTQFPLWGFTSLHAVAIQLRHSSHGHNVSHLQLTSTQCPIIWKQLLLFTLLGQKNSLQWIYRVTFTTAAPVSCFSLIHALGCAQKHLTRSDRAQLWDCDTGFVIQAVTLLFATTSEACVNTESHGEKHKTFISFLTANDVQVLANVDCHKTRMCSGVKAKRCLGNWNNVTFRKKMCH